MIVNSVRKTKKCLVVDCDWTFGGMSGEIASIVSKECFKVLQKPVERLGFKHIPCPTARHLENSFYPNAENIVRKCGVKEIIRPYCNEFGWYRVF